MTKIIVGSLVTKF